MNQPAAPRNRDSVIMIEDDEAAARFGVAADVSTAVGCQAIADRFSDVDVLVNNAAVPRAFEDIPTSSGWRSSRPT